MICQSMNYCAFLVFAPCDITGSDWEGLDKRYGKLWSSGNSRNFCVGRWIKIPAQQGHQPKGERNRACMVEVKKIIDLQTHQGLKKVVEGQI